jgi:hypothetical protein
MATRYWVGGGSSSNWNATGNTNWSATSGGANNASVPTSADDVIFDGAGATGDTNSTISATITILSLDIQTGYTATMTHNAVLTIAGNWTYTGNYTIAGASGITISAASTITSNGITWPNALTFSGTNTKTLVGNLSVNGVFSTSSTQTINKTTNEILISNGGFGAGVTVGSADIYLQGGIWSGNNFVSNLIYLNGNVTLSGTVQTAGGLTYLSGTITTTSSTLFIAGTLSLDTNGVTWNNVRTDSSSKTISLTSNLLMSGLFTNSGVTTINTSNSSTWTTSGGVTVNANSLGNAKVILTGGTWSGGSSISNNLDIDGDVTISGNVAKAGGTLTYVSGTVTTTGSTLSITSSCTLNTDGITWNNFSSITNTKTITLTSNLLVGGLFQLRNANTTLNRTTSETLTVTGGLDAGANILGTADFYLNGVSWFGSGDINTNLYINGNVTITGVVSKGGTGTSFIYLGGNVTTAGSTFTIKGSITLNSYGIIWNNVNSFGGLYIVTLTSDFIINGRLLTSDGAYSFNKTVNESVIVNGGIGGRDGITGNANIYLRGGTWSSTASSDIISSNLFIDGNVTIIGNVFYRLGTLTYVSGKVNSFSATLNITLPTTMIGFNKCPLRSIVVTAGQTLTVNELPCGTASQICSITSTGANYTIAFQDGFEKIGRFVSLSGATISRPMQLLVTSGGVFNTNRSTNALGIRYFNQSPNGVPKNKPSINDTMTVPALGLVGDPCFQRQ